MQVYESDQEDEKQADERASRKAKPLPKKLKPGPSVSQLKHMHKVYKKGKKGLKNPRTALGTDEAKLVAYKRAASLLYEVAFLAPLASAAGRVAAGVGRAGLKVASKTARSAASTVVKNKMAKEKDKAMKRTRQELVDRLRSKKEDKDMEEGIRVQSLKQRLAEALRGAEGHKDPKTGKTSFAGPVAKGVAKKPSGFVKKQMKHAKAAIEKKIGKKVSPSKADLAQAAMNRRANKPNRRSIHTPDK
jgi:hypothetical protein